MYENNWKNGDMEICKKPANISHSIILCFYIAFCSILFGFHLILNVGFFFKILNVGINITTNVDINMTTDVRQKSSVRLRYT